jgi:carboxymethylenebutenolidase
MPDIQLPFSSSRLTAYEALPPGSGERAGIVVVHDALGMSPDLRAQCDWLAEAGYHAVAPDLFDGKTVFACLFTIFRQMSKKRGPLFEKVEAVRRHLLDHPDSNGKVGVIGFCFGGSFAVILAASGDFDVASINYGPLSRESEDLLSRACPVVPVMERWIATSREARPA